MAPQKSDLPFGSEFSPSQIDLARVLTLAGEHDGDWHGFEEAVWQEYFVTPGVSEYNQKKKANNTKLGLQAYGLMDKDGRLTVAGADLLGQVGDERALYKGLARHILLNLHGVTLVQCILDMQNAGEKVDLISLREWLGERGIHFPRGGKHPSIMRLWLERAGVFTSGWQVDRRRFEELAGASMEEIEALAALTPQQRSYLKTLANIGDPGPFASNELEKLANATYGTKFNEKNVPKDVLYPLRDAGFITAERTTSGSGAKPFLVAPTGKMKVEVLLPLLKQVEMQVLPELRPFLRKPLEQVLAELDSPDKHVRGLALEALAVRLMRIIDLTYVATRLRGRETGGAEVDVLFESARLVFSRWQVQCKNTAAVSLDDVAKEVGLTKYLKSTVVVILTTGRIGPEARRFANWTMQNSSLCVALVDGQDVKAIVRHPPAIVDVLNREAANAMALKKLNLKE